MLRQWWVVGNQWIVEIVGLVVGLMLSRLRWTLRTRSRRDARAHVLLGPPEVRELYGISDSLVRYACGIEDPEDLIEDLEVALRAV